MPKIQERFIVDAKGRKKAVVLDLKDYKKILELLEDAFDLKLIEKSKKEPAIPWEEAKKKLRKEGLL